MIADELSSVGRLLSADQEWCRLACQLDIQYSVYKEFDEHRKLIGSRKSPTMEVLQWLAHWFPDMTLADFVVVLEKTKCKNAIQIITAHFPDMVGEYSTHSFSDLLCYFV